LRVFENMVLRRIFGPRWVKVIGGGAGEDCIMRSFIYALPNIIRVTKSRMTWECSMHGGNEKCVKKSMLKRLKGRDQL